MLLTLLLHGQDDQNVRVIMSILFNIIFRGIGTIVCSSKARELNRNHNKWGIIGLIFPLIAMIWIHNKKPRISWEENSKIDCK